MNPLDGGHFDASGDRLLCLPEAPRGRRVRREPRAHELHRTVRHLVRLIHDVGPRVHIRASHQYFEQVERVPLVLDLVRRGVELSHVLEPVGSLVHRASVASSLQLRLDLRPERAVLLQLLTESRAGKVDRCGRRVNR